jgi:hypothetical protein
MTRAGWEAAAVINELQFDHAVTSSASSGDSGSESGRPAVVCVVCHSAVDTEYFQINRSIVCPRCRAGVETAVETPRGMMPLAVAGLFGLGAGIAGAVIYYAVIAFAHLEIGIVAILIGYMVGYAVRKGARGRGGLRFQVLAVILTYMSVGLAYAPIALKQAASTSRGHRAPGTEDQSGAEIGRIDTGRAGQPRPLLFSLPVAAAFLAGLVLTLPVLVVFGSFPSGLISAVIIFIGMRQAWRMTSAPWLQILGPYRVGAGPVAANQTGSDGAATPA